MSTQVDGLDPGLAADLLAAIADGDPRRAAVVARLGVLNAVPPLADFHSARSVRSELLVLAAGAAKTMHGVTTAWTEARKTIVDEAWKAVAADPARWRGEYVVERLETRRGATSDAYDLPSPPPARFSTFVDLDVATTPRAVRISGESLPGLTFNRIERGLEGASGEAVIECASRWRQFGAEVLRSTEPVERIVSERCSDDAGVHAVRIPDLIDWTRRVAGQWTTIGNATHLFGLGLRQARTEIAALRRESDSAIAACDSDFSLLVQRPVVVEAFERRARAIFDETYGAGLFGLVAGLRAAGEPVGCGVPHG